MHIQWQWRRAGALVLQRMLFFNLRGFAGKPSKTFEPSRAHVNRWSCRFEVPPWKASSLPHTVHFAFLASFFFSKNFQTSEGALPLPPLLQLALPAPLLLVIFATPAHACRHYAHACTQSWVWGVAAKVREGANKLPRVVEAAGKCERSHIRCSTSEHFQ